ncbi:MAG: ABC transporter substrate-binding protein [Alphaproteobacteria bacterium]|nr:ABC transporter substrate-binding protein [Alphaproteobacteria bacterium]
MLIILGDAAKKVPQFQWDVSIEKIATLNPDIIFISEWNVGDAEERCTAAGNVTATFCSMGAKYTIEIVQNNLLMVADALNKTEKAKELIATMNERIASLKARVLSAGLDKKTVSIMRVRPNEYEFATPMAPVMIQSVGLTVPKGQFSPYPTPDDFDWSGANISLENLDKAQADYLFITVDLDNNGALEALQNNPLFPTLPSVKNNQIFLVETGVWNSFDYIANNTVLDQIEKLIIEPAEKAN